MLVSRMGIVKFAGRGVIWHASDAAVDKEPSKMKRTFELVVFTHGNASADKAEPAVSAATKSGVRQGDNWQARRDSLTALAGTLNLKVHDQHVLSAGAGDNMSEGGCRGESVAPIWSVGRDSVVLLAGTPTAAELSAGVAMLKNHGNDIVIVVDALRDLAGLFDTLTHLNEQAVQLVPTGAVKMMITGDHLMLYRFPKADSTTTTAVFADIDKDDPLVLTLVRGANPYKGMESLPGGFLNVQLETLAECAAREVTEECFVNAKSTGDSDKFTYLVPADEMVLIDVRSEPDRDERGHVVDHGYAWYIKPGVQADILSKINAGDDAQAGSARFVRVSELLKRDLAFDHKKLLTAAVARLKGKS